MSHSTLLRAAALLGFISTAVLAGCGWIGIVDGLVTLAAATMVPLGAALALCPLRNGSLGSDARVATALVCISSVAMPATVLSPRGSIVALLGGIVHLAATLALAVAAGRRLTQRGPMPLDELAIDAGSIYLPVGAAFALASRAEVHLLGFSEPILSFTAAHFHYAGFAAPTIIGCVGRLGHAYGAPTARAYRASVVAVVSGIPLTALGINGGATLERAAALMLACGMVLATFVAVAIAMAEHRRPLVPRLILAASFAGLVVPMVLAAAFASTGSAGRDGALSELVPLTVMIRYHGAINALWFSIPALAALSWLAPAPRHAAAGFALSHLRGGWTIGADYFQRAGALSHARSPTGIIESLEDYQSVSFDPASVHRDVRSFYEHTADYDLDVTPRWERGFVSGGRLWRRVARNIGQVELPTDASTDERVRSRIVDLDDAVDGREGARAWIRTYQDNGRALYVAAYAATESQGTRLMNIAFPLPGCALVSVLRFVDGDAPGSLRVTTEGRDGELAPDEGIFLATRWFVVRMPMMEWIRVEPTTTPDNTTARHELFLFGRRYLTLDYAIHRSAADAAG